MSHTFARRCALGAAVVLVAILGAGCEPASVTGPHAPSQRAAQRALHDDDPATCLNGYTEVDGHIYCNPM